MHAIVAEQCALPPAIFFIAWKLYTFAFAKGFISLNVQRCPFPSAKKWDFWCWNKNIDHFLLPTFPKWWTRHLFCAFTILGGFKAILKIWLTLSCFWVAFPEAQTKNKKRAEGQLKMRSNRKVQKRKPPNNQISYPNPTGRVLILKFNSTWLIPPSRYGHILPYSQVVYAEIYHCLMIEFLKCEGLELKEHQVWRAPDPKNIYNFFTWCQGNRNLWRYQHYVHNHHIAQLNHLNGEFWINLKIYDIFLKSWCLLIYQWICLYWQANPHVRVQLFFVQTVTNFSPLAFQWHLIICAQLFFHISDCNFKNVHKSWWSPTHFNSFCNSVSNESNFQTELSKDTNWRMDLIVIEFVSPKY